MVASTHCVSTRFLDLHNKAEVLSTKPGELLESEKLTETHVAQFSQRLSDLVLTCANNKIFSLSRPNIHRLHVDFDVPQIHPTRIPLPRFFYGPSTKGLLQKTALWSCKPFRLVFDFREKSNAFWLSRDSYMHLQKALEAAPALSPKEVNDVIDSFRRPIDRLAAELLILNSSKKGFGKFAGWLFLKNPWGQYKSLIRSSNLLGSINKQLTGGIVDEVGEGSAPSLTTIKLNKRLESKSRAEGFLDFLKDLHWASKINFAWPFFVVLAKARVCFLSGSIKKIEHAIEQQNKPSTYASEVRNKDGVKSHRRSLAHQAALYKRAGITPNSKVVREINQEYEEYIDNIPEWQKPEKSYADFYYDKFFASVSSYSDASVNYGAQENSLSGQGFKLKEISSLILASAEGKSLRRNVREWLCIIKDISKQENCYLDEGDKEAIRILHDRLVNKHAFDVTKISQIFIHCGYGFRAQDKQRVYTDAIPEVVRLMRKIEGASQGVSSRMLHYNLDVPNLLLSLSVESIVDGHLKQLQNPQGKEFFKTIAAKLPLDPGGLTNGELYGACKALSKGKATIEDLKVIVRYLNNNSENKKEFKKIVIDNKWIFFQTSGLDFFRKEAFGISKILSSNRRYKNCQFMQSALNLDVTKTLADYRQAVYATLKGGNSWVQGTAKTSPGLGMSAAILSNVVPYATMIFNYGLGLKFVKITIPVIADLLAYALASVAGLFDPTFPLMVAISKQQRLKQLREQLEITDKDIDLLYEQINQGDYNLETEPVLNPFWKEFKRCHGTAHKNNIKTIYSGAAETLQWVFLVARNLAEKATGKNQSIAFEDHATQYLSEVHSKILKNRFIGASTSDNDWEQESLRDIKVVAASLFKVVVTIGLGGSLAAFMGLLASPFRLLWRPIFPDESGFGTEQKAVSDHANLHSLDTKQFFANQGLILKDIFNNPFAVLKYLPIVIANSQAASAAIFDLAWNKIILSILVHDLTDFVWPAHVASPSAMALFSAQKPPSAVLNDGQNSTLTRGAVKKVGQFTMVSLPHLDVDR